MFQCLMLHIYIFQTKQSKAAWIFICSYECLSTFIEYIFREIIHSYVLLRYYDIFNIAECHRFALITGLNTFKSCGAYLFSCQNKRHGIGQFQ